MKLQDRSIGNKLKQARLETGLTLSQIAGEIKIRKEVLESLENDNFEKEGSHVYIKGFIKNYAKYLELDHEALIALYRRDYENKDFKREVKNEKVKSEKLKVKNSKISKLSNVSITSRHLAFIFIFTIISISSLAVFRIVKGAFEKPYLKINAPFQIEGSYSGSKMIEEKSIIIKGKTEEGSAVKINEEPVKLNPDYTFESEPVQVANDNSIVIIEARNQIGISSKIELNIEKPEGFKEKDGFTGLESIITIKDAEAFVLIRADGIIKFNDQVFPGDAIAINAENSIELETSNPETFDININGSDFELMKVQERFEIQNGNVIRK